MSNIFTYDDIKLLFGISQKNHPLLSLTNIVIDSRQHLDHSLFVALKTPHNDGHYYIDDVLHNMSNCVVSHQKTYPNHDRVIYVEDTADIITKIALYKRQYYQTTWVAITGSVGKTSLKNLLGTLLQDFSCYSTKANVNNMLGVPLNMAQSHIITSLCCY